ncbi:MAG: metalloregulator ArsR/SmtB family transcription factor [Myxococcales bacterium]|nr:metalloregulator ArsR/SmtB family transcription factor [Myxococcales bacterium]
MDFAIASTERRWELYRLLGEPVRLRLLALAAEEELAIGELAELLGESQPNVSRHLKALRGAHLLTERKEGTRVFVRLSAGLEADPVIADALAAGGALCEADGSLSRVAEVVAAREAPARAFFDDASGDEPTAWPSELGAYLTALAPLVPRRRLAVDVGTGDGSFLEVLAPVFERVIAIDRSEAQLARARARLARRAYENVELALAELGDTPFEARVAELGGADAVCASRVLHHAPRPAAALTGLARLLAPGGAVVVVDYVAHADERMREQQADAWLGFAPRELTKLATRAGLEDAAVLRVPAVRCGDGPDGHLDWQVLCARRPTEAT